MKKHKKIFKILFIVLFIFMMTGCQSIDNLDFNQWCLKCGEKVYFPVYLVKLVANLFQFVQVMVPAAIIIVGLIELFKAVIASDENKMAESKAALIRKVISGILIFLVFAVVQFAFTVVPNFTDDEIDVLECMSHFVNGVDFQDPCPSRTNGKAVGTKDDESGLKPSDWEEPVKRDGTDEECYGFNDEECATNKYYNCSWDTDCESCTSVNHVHNCKKICYKCTINGQVTYKFTDKPPANCREYQYDPKYGYMDNTQCHAAAEAEEKKQKENGKCWLCYYGYATYQGANKKLVWNGSNPSPNCKIEGEDCCIEQKDIAYEECYGVINKNSKKCYKCTISGKTSYSYTLEPPKKGKDCTVLGYATTKDRCNANYERIHDNGGACWECADRRIYWRINDPSTNGNKCEEVNLEKCDSIRKGIAEDGYLPPQPYCWDCYNTVIQQDEYLWQAEEPAGHGACNKLAEIKKPEKCNHEGHMELQDETQKKKKGSCYICGKPANGASDYTAGMKCVENFKAGWVEPGTCYINVYWAPKGVTAKGSWYCKLYSDLDQEWCEDWEKRPDLIINLKNP